MLEELHERLAAVVIECLPYDAFIRRYNRPGTLFYIDPPYWGCEDDYGKGLFERADCERLNELLKALKGRFIPSPNDVPELRELFAGFPSEEAETTYHIAGVGKTKRAAELIITNIG